MNRVCTSCDLKKPLISFYTGKFYTDGFSTQCKMCLREKTKKYKKNNPKVKKERVILSDDEKKLRKKQRRVKYRKRRAEIQKQRLENEPLFKLKRNLRNRVWALMRGVKSKSTQELLGASYEKVKLHIESTFTEGMSWGNYGQWHVDHKMPLSSATTNKELEELFHYTNLQALWGSDNSSKKDKVIWNK